MKKALELFTNSYHRQLNPVSSEPEKPPEVKKDPRAAFEFFWKKIEALKPELAALIDTPAQMEAFLCLWGDIIEKKKECECMLEGILERKEKIEDV